jgi:hypothetical protein
MSNLFTKGVKFCVQDCGGGVIVRIKYGFWDETGMEDQKGLEK